MLTKNAGASFLKKLMGKATQEASKHLDDVGKPFVGQLDDLAKSTRGVRSVQREALNDGYTYRAALDKLNAQPEKGRIGKFIDRFRKDPRKAYEGKLKDAELRYGTADLEMDGLKSIKKQVQGAHDTATRSAKTRLRKAQREQTTARMQAGAGVGILGGGAYMAANRQKKPRFNAYDRSLQNFQNR